MRRRRLLPPQQPGKGRPMPLSRICMRLQPLAFGCRVETTVVKPFHIHKPSKIYSKRRYDPSACRYLPKTNLWPMPLSYTPTPTIIPNGNAPSMRAKHIAYLLAPCVDLTRWKAKVMSPVIVAKFLCTGKAQPSTRFFINDVRTSHGLNIHTRALAKLLTGLLKIAQQLLQPNNATQQHL